MISRLKFVLGWVKYNRLMTAVYILVLSMIVCSTVLLMQFFYEQSTYDQNGKYYYCYYFDEGLDIDAVDAILQDLYEAGINPLECEVASDDSDDEIMNEYKYGAYFVLNENEQQSRNENYSFGAFENERYTCIADSSNTELKLGENLFEIKGEGSVIIGSLFCDFLITETDYREYVNEVDAIEFTLSNRTNEISTLIDKYNTDYTEEKNTGILESGLKSINGTAVISFLLILISVYSVLSFVEIMINLQKNDIVVFYECGASPNDIKKLYVSEIMTAGMLSFIFGCVLSCILVNTVGFNFKAIYLWVYIAGFLIFEACYYIEASIYIRKTISYVGMILKEEE